MSRVQGMIGSVGVDARSASPTKGHEMATGFVHVNGVTYTLAGPADATVTSPMADRLRAGGSGTETLHVDVEGGRATVTVQLSHVWASGAWNVEEPDKTVRVPRRIY